MSAPRASKTAADDAASPDAARCSGVSPTGVLRPDIGPVVQQHPRHRDRVPPRRRVQRRDALRGRRPDVGPARRKHGGGRAAVARRRIVQRRRRCSIGNVRVCAAIEQIRHDLARGGGCRDVERGRAGPAKPAAPVLAAAAQRAQQPRTDGLAVSPQPRVQRRPGRQAAPGPPPASPGQPRSAGPPTRCRPPPPRTTRGPDGRRVPLAS